MHGTGQQGLFTCSAVGQLCLLCTAFAVIVYSLSTDSLAVLQTALDAVAPGGKIVLVGLGQERCCVPTMQTVFKELDFLGSFRYVNTVSCLTDCGDTAAFDHMLSSVLPLHHSTGCPWYVDACM